eukprot:scpid77227/ scgid6111/ 
MDVSAHILHSGSMHDAALTTSNASSGVNTANRRWLLFPALSPKSQATHDTYAAHGATQPQLPQSLPYNQTVTSDYTADDSTNKIPIPNASNPSATSTERADSNSTHACMLQTIQRESGTKAKHHQLRMHHPSGKAAVARTTSKPLPASCAKRKRRKRKDVTRRQAEKELQAYEDPAGMCALEKQLGDLDMDSAPYRKLTTASTYRVLALPFPRPHHPLQLSMSERNEREVYLRHMKEPDSINPCDGHQGVVRRITPDSLDSGVSSAAHIMSPASLPHLG